MPFQNPVSRGAESAAGGLEFPRSGAATAPTTGSGAQRRCRDPSDMFQCDHGNNPKSVRDHFDRRGRVPKNVVSGSVGNADWVLRQVDPPCGFTGNWHGWTSHPWYPHVPIGTARPSHPWHVQVHLVQVDKPPVAPSSADATGGQATGGTPSPKRHDYYRACLTCLTPCPRCP